MNLLASALESAVAPHHSKKMDLDYQSHPNGKSTVVTKASLFSGRVHNFEIPLSIDEFEEAFSKWALGALVKEAFPTLSADEREFLMTGVTPDEWTTTYETHAS